MRKTIGILAALAFLVVALVSTVNALTVTIAAPGNGSTLPIKNSVTVEATLATHGGINVTNVSFWWSGDGTTFTFIGVNTSVNASNYTTSLNTKTHGLNDTEQYYIRAIAANYSDSVETTGTRSGYYVDNTIPVITWVDPSADHEMEEVGVEFSATCVNASTAYLYIGGSTYLMTMSGTGGAETCKYEADGVPTPGIHDATIKAYDDANINETTSDLKYLNFDVRGEAAKDWWKLQQFEKEETKEQQSNLLGIAIIVGLIIWAVKAGKKGRRK